MSAYLGGRLGCVSRYPGSVSGWHVPKQELCDAVDRVVRDVCQDVSEIAFRVDLVELGCAVQRVSA